MHESDRRQTNDDRPRYTERHVAIIGIACMGNDSAQKTAWV